ncbi:hypothetical protein VTJ04DRAFT_1068 [Mycothermus thermophilus]|uniref:uncharacterized protein n=1 Tax=Humicola insolens TaxID=85995 RepID=UPI0037440EA9
MGDAAMGAIVFVSQTHQPVFRFTSEISASSSYRARKVRDNLGPKTSGMTFGHWSLTNSIVDWRRWSRGLLPAEMFHTPYAQHEVKK